MFNKPILPSFLSSSKSAGNPVPPPARPPMHRQAVAQEAMDAQKAINEALKQNMNQATPTPEPAQPIEEKKEVPDSSEKVVSPQVTAPTEAAPATPIVSNAEIIPPAQTNPEIVKKEEIVRSSVATKIIADEKKEPVFSNQALAPTDADGVVRGPNLHDTRFSDIWFTPENIAYVRDVRTHFALTPIETPDLEDFRRALEQGYQGASSYAIKFAGDSYRVERVMTNDGVQYNCRKMPTSTPEIEDLGFAPPIVKHLSSLVRSAGLLLFAGPTGQGKTTSASAIMKRFLDTEGGFLFTIEDPPEMPLGGLYHAKNGGLGLCKQTPVENDQWGACLRSALRSKPRYILVGEIRTPETASQCLVAATSGHLVLSTIHANGVEDALNSLIKYAASTGLDESLVSDLLARGILGVIYQRLEGVEKLKLHYETAFANPNTAAADQMRMAIRDGSINLATFMETQATRMSKGLPMFKDQ